MKLVIGLLSALIPYGFYAYGIMFGILIACGFGFPMPEDVILVVGGILASRDIVDFYGTIVVCMLGVLIGDGTVFTIGRKMGPKIKNTKIFKRIMKVKREKKVKEWFAKYGDKVIFFARFAPGLRMPLFLTAGMYQISPWKFLAFDGFAAIISVPIWIWIGFLFGSNMERLEEKMQQMQFGVYSVLGLIVLVIFSFWFMKRKVKDS